MGHYKCLHNTSGYIILEVNQLQLADSLNLEIRCIELHKTWTICVNHILSASRGIPCGGHLLLMWLVPRIHLLSNSWLTKILTPSGINK